MLDENKDNNEKLEIINPNYYQKKIFIDLLSNQFIRFTKSDYLKPNGLFHNLSIIHKNSNIGKQKTKEIRELIINSLINNTKLFIKGPYENLIKEQETTENIISSYSDENQNRKAIDDLVKKKQKTMITYDNIKQSIIAFDDNESSISFKIIPRAGCTKEELSKLTELFESQNFLKKKERFIEPKFKTKEQLLFDLLDLCGAENEIKQEEYRIKIEEKFPTYIFTTDNYIKMIHILMKTRARIPIIMIGETGCGKTSLIKMLSLIKNKGENFRMKILNIHQSVDDEEISNFLKKAMEETEKEDEEKIRKKKKEYDDDNIEEFEYIQQIKLISELEKEENKNSNKKKKKVVKAEDGDTEVSKFEKKRKQNYQEIENKVKNEQMWIFFDEINTSNSMGLISEIFCNHTYRGKAIPERYIFIGACNPYRILSENSRNLEFGLNKNKKKRNLVYTVNPLPHSLLNYVIDFGELTPKDTEKYIQSMLYKELRDIDAKLLLKAVKAVTECQLFIKEKGDTSNVSLREIKYFVTFYQSFIKYYKFLKELSKKINDKKQLIQCNNSMRTHLKEISPIPDKSFKENSINLSLYISYYLRLPIKELRKELCERLNKEHLFQYGFLDIPEKESKFLIDQIEINPQRGIAKNKALRENIFCEFFCLINKIPLIICGKPGNSKTLSVQLLLDSMKGKSSLSEFFKNPEYKEIMTYPFQGSATCTTKGVLKTFNKARNFAKKNKDMISLVFFDEMGLAEDSPENPLKVLHAELENEENKVAFLGLSIGL